MKIVFKRKAKIFALVAAFAAIAAVGVFLDRVERDRFVIETVPPDVNGADNAVSAMSALSESAGVSEDTEDTTPDENDKDEFIGGKVNINTAGADVLSQLDGIGEKTAEKIIEYREEHGPFNAIEELTLVNGIGEKKLEAIKDRICAE
jgi:competence ComEA-like helix-hairpin-helix protein